MPNITISPHCNGQKLRPQCCLRCPRLCAASQNEPEAASQGSSPPVPAVWPKDEPISLTLGVDE